jgi:hypothetical protein
MAVKPADTNENGKVSVKERRAYKRKNTTSSGGLKPDTLNRQQLAAKYGFALKVIYSNPEIRSAFEQAVQQQATPEGFDAAIQNTNWYKNNSSSARAAWVAETMGGADWDTQKDAAEMAVKNAAVTAGAELTPEELDDLTRRYIYEGWSATERAGFLDRALAEQIDAGGEGEFLQGAAGSLQESLASTAERNGIKLGNDYYQAAARSVAYGLTTAEDWDRDVREMSASMWPPWKEKIMAGVDARDLASGYINVMSQTFEIAPEAVDINDPYIRQAMTGVDEQGNPVQLGLWDFQTKLREDPRWMGTKQATDKMSTIGNDILKMFGFAG